MEPIKVSVSVRGLFYRRRKNGLVEFLILRRSQENKNNQGLWQVSGGKQEKKDISLLVTHNRETREELGLHFFNRLKSAAKKIGSISYLREDGAVRFVHHGFLREAQSNVRIKRSSEHDQHLWVTLGDLDRFHFVKGAKELIARAHAQLAQQSLHR